jgi:uncharacterized protein
MVDGENIDATLGSSILGRRPQSEERPRWERPLQFCRDQWGNEVTGLFFLAANDPLPMPFVQALLAIGYRPIPLSGAGHQKVVDLAIQRTLEALQDTSDDVMLVSHDGDFLPQLRQVCDGRRVGVMGFKEFCNLGFAELGVEFFDLEYDVKAFNGTLPRIRVIPIDEFDPRDFL